MLGSFAKLLIPQLPVTVRQLQCINQSGRELCRLCQSACPHQAVEEVNPVSVNVNRCTACGVCQGICPTEAIQIDAFNPAKVLTNVLETSCITCRCSAQEGVKISCISAIPRDLWLAMAQGFKGHRIRVCMGTCANCPEKQAVPRQLQILNNINKLVPVFNIEYDKEIEPSEAESKLSRRDFFSTLRRQSIKSVIGTVLSDDEEESLSTVKRAREILLQMVAKSQNPILLPMPYVVVKKLCSGCGNCESLCPRGAWRVVDNTLVYRRQICIGCGICCRNCPQHCLELTEAPVCLNDYTSVVNELPNR